MAILSQIPYYLKTAGLPNGGPKLPVASKRNVLETGKISPAGGSLATLRLLGVNARHSPADGILAILPTAVPSGTMRAKVHPGGTNAPALWLGTIQTHQWSTTHDSCCAEIVGRTPTSRHTRSFPLRPLGRPFRGSCPSLSPSQSVSQRDLVDDTGRSTRPSLRRPGRARDADKDVAFGSRGGTRFRCRR